MDSQSYFETVIAQLMRQLGVQEQNCEKDINITDPQGNTIKLTPRKALVLAGLILDVLNIDSLVLNANKTFEVILAGTLERKTPLDKCVENIGKKPFDEVVKSIIKNLGNV